MVSFIYGTAGSGKTTEAVKVCAEALKSGRQVFFLVPEQMVLESEKKITEYTAKFDIPTLGLEVVSFRRLANRVFRTYGGLSYNYIGNGGRILVMWKALCAIAPSLKKYKDITSSDRGTLTLLLGAVDELKNNGILPENLLEVSEELEKGEYKSVYEKTSDIALIYSAFQHSLEKNYSDPKDDLVRLYSMLCSNDFFCNSIVVADSFFGYTAIEKRILERIMTQCENFTVTLPLLPDTSDGFRKTVGDTEKFFLSVVYKNGVKIGNKIILKSGVRFKSEELRSLESNLWKSDAEVCSVVPSDITLIEAANPYREAEAISSKILKNVRNGCRYSDNVIIFRKADDWNGIIDAVLEKNGIPYFISERTDLSSEPLIRLVSSALSVVAGGWRLDDILTMIKTGLAGLTPDECNLLENYASMWRINGKMWYSDGEWSMNPDGYTDKLTESGANLLMRVNELKQNIINPLMMLSLGKATVREYATALVSCLEEMGVAKTLFERNDEIGERLWDSVCDCLDCLVTVSEPDGEENCEKISISDFAKLFEIALIDSDIGRIPPLNDAVIVGGCMLLRTENCKNVFVIGANEGKFPADVTDDGIWNDNDRVALESVGLELSAGSDTRYSDEMFYFYRSLTTASESVTLSYSQKGNDGVKLNPSFGVENVKKLFPKIVTEIFDSSDALSVVQNEAEAFEYAAYRKNEAVSKILLELLSESEHYKNAVEAFDIPLSTGEEKIDESLLKEKYGGNICLSSTSLETYAKCAFSYFCKYVLELNSASNAVFGGADVGKYIHCILEEYMRLIRDGEFNPEMASEDDFEKVINGISDKYKEIILGVAGQKKNARISHLFRRMKRTAVLLAKNLSDEYKESSFRPTFFELPISFAEDAVNPSPIPIEGGGNVYLHGRIDRVDTFRRDDDLYVRVTDYKTVKKSFSYDDIDKGINMQLLLYLFSICDNGADGNKLISKDNLSIKPAGALYFTAKAPETQSDGSETEEEIKRNADKMFTRNGILLRDEEIITAMEKSRSGRFIPVKMKKDGDFYQTDKLIDSEDFDLLKKRVYSKTAEIAGEIRCGRADANPLKESQNNSCEYCALKPLCRK